MDHWCCCYIVRGHRHLFRHRLLLCRRRRRLSPRIRRFLISPFDYRYHLSCIGSRPRRPCRLQLFSSSPCLPSASYKAARFRLLFIPGPWSSVLIVFAVFVAVILIIVAAVVVVAVAVAGVMFSQWVRKYPSMFSARTIVAVYLLRLGVSVLSKSVCSVEAVEVF